jgi:hypothetical protein
VKRDRAEEAIVRFVADELPSPEAIAVARRAYQEVMREELEVRARNSDSGYGAHGGSQDSRDVEGRGALGGRRACCARGIGGQATQNGSERQDKAPAMNADTFEFGVQRCQDAVRNLGAHLRKGEQASEARALVRSYWADSVRF